MKPFRITIDTNPDVCNLNCIMCDTHSKYSHMPKKRKSMPKSLLEKIISEAIGIGVEEIIPSTMGEPLLYSHFDTFIEKLQSSDVKMNLTTNGTFPRYSLDEWAFKIFPILSDIKISINSLDSKINESIMVGDNTKAKIDNIKNLVLLRDKINPKSSVTLQVTFMNRNIDSLSDLIDFAVENKINRVKGHQLWVTHNEIKSEDILSKASSITKWNEFVNLIEEKRKLINLVNFTKIETRRKDECNKELICPFLGKELWIDHEGNFNVCCAPSEMRKTLGKWGNVKNQSILNVFNSDNYLDLVNNYKNIGVCKECPLRKAK